MSGIDAATAAIAIQLQVPFASILAAFVFGDKPGWRRLLGMAIAFVGVAIIAGEPRLGGAYGSLALVIGASMCWSVANIQIKRLQGVGGMTFNAWMAVFATPQLLLGSYVLEQGQWQALQEADWRILLTIVYQAIAVVVIGYSVWMWLLRQYDINQAMPLTLLVPPIGVLSGVLFLGEKLTLALLVGGALTIVGVAIILIRRPRTAAARASRV
jgi:O-acetylserine/cysteine efflux transporter